MTEHVMAGHDVAEHGVAGQDVAGHGVAGQAEAAEVLGEMWARIDAQDWDGMAGLLDPRLEVRYTDTGETFDPAAFVRLNREYPGRWHVDVEDVVGAGDRAVSPAPGSATARRPFMSPRSRPCAAAG